VLLGTGSNNTQSTVELTREAEKLGADAVMAVVPYYNKPPQEALYAHFKTVAQSTSLGVLMYNVPFRTGCNLEPATVARLAQIENIRYIKEASGNMDQVSAIRSQTDASFEIYSGDDSLTLPILAIGGTGVVSVASHIVGREMKEMVNSFSQGNTAGAREIHLKLFPLFRALFMASNPIPLKAALNLMGLGVGGLRLPLVSLSYEDELRLRKVLDNYVEI
jgi:4-hydroxy-tetrahydrodipicolinate synthase